MMPMYDDLEKATRSDDEGYLNAITRRHVAQSMADWMAHIDDETPLSALTLPGTHDSAAFTSRLPFIQTQTLSIDAQLEAGIRYLDLRCGLRDNVVEMVHGMTCLGLTLRKLLESVYNWLEKHATEAIVIQIKEDRRPERSTIAFSQAIIACISQRTQTWLTSDKTPTLGESRGRIQLFRRFVGPGLSTYGIDVTPWQDNPPQPFTIVTERGIRLTIQDHYSFNDPQTLPVVLAVKTDNVKRLLQFAAADTDHSRWYMNFTSAVEFNFWYQLSPRQIAVGGYVNFRWQNGINPGVRHFLVERHSQMRTRYGIIIMDFPELGASDLLEQLVATNFTRNDQRAYVVPATPTFLLTVAVITTWVVWAYQLRPR